MYKNLKQTTFTEQEVACFFLRNDYLFVDPFSKHVDISSYVHKIYENGEILVAYDNEIRGLSCMYVNDFETFFAHLQVFLVDSKLQNNGVGRRLLLSTFAEARNAGMKYIELVVDNINNKAISLYKKEGFSYSKKVHTNILKSYMLKEIQEK